MTTEVMDILKGLKADTPAKFGLMTAQHMVEHLCFVTKVSVKRIGEAPAEPTEGQKKFKHFISRGARFKHFPNNKTAADLPKFKYSSLEEAIENLPEAVNRFYNHYEANPDFKCYNGFQGELNFQELEVLHYMHFRYHLDQFSLIDKGW